jgi:hypothetical protein
VFLRRLNDPAMTSRREPGIERHSAGTSECLIGRPPRVTLDLTNNALSALPPKPEGEPLESQSVAGTVRSKIKLSSISITERRLKQQAATGEAVVRAAHRINQDLRNVPIQSAS